jgi:hypothetical protein
VATTIDAPRTAVDASVGVTSYPFADICAQNSRRRVRERPTTRISLSVRTTAIASTWVSASAPVPKTARMDASRRASRLVAYALTAAVRRAVSVAPSSNAASRPWASRTTTTPAIVGAADLLRPWSTRSTLQRRPPRGAPPGITTQSWPASGMTSRSGASGSLSNACPVASISSGHGRTSRVSSSVRTIGFATLGMGATPRRTIKWSDQ